MAAIPQPVAKLFSDDYRFKIPYFQRGYAWREVHVLRLLADIEAAAAGSLPMNWYPLGVIILARQPGEDDAWLADGQQRLITLTILLAVLRDLETDADLAAALGRSILRAPATAGAAPLPADARLVPQQQIEGLLFDHVQASGATAREAPDDLDDQSEGSANVIANRDRLRAVLAAKPDDERRRIARFLLDSCIILVVSVDNHDVARLLFSTMHDTGLRPTPVDLFKAQVLSPLADEARNDARSTWEDLEARLGRQDFEVVLREIAILETRARPRRQVEAILLDTFGLATADGAQRFLDAHLRPLGHHYAAMTQAMFGAGPLSPPQQRCLQHLSWVRNHDGWMTPALHWLATRADDAAQTDEFLRRLEAHAWVQMILAPEPDRRDKRYLAVLEAIDAGRRPADIEALAVASQDITAIREILAKPSFTRRDYRQFLLLRLDTVFAGGDGAQQVPAATIEHILPRRPGANSQWRQVFTAAQADALRNSLGNLTLLTKSEQNAAGNADFERKRGVYRTSAFALTRQLAQGEAWRPDDVRERTSALIEALLRDWGLA